MSEQTGCTGTSATWCPIHGDCRCPYIHGIADNGRTLDDPGCPLHGATSAHGDEPMVFPEIERGRAQGPLANEPPAQPSVDLAEAMRVAWEVRARDRLMPVGRRVLADLIEQLVAAVQTERRERAEDRRVAQDALEQVRGDVAKAREERDGLRDALDVALKEIARLKADHAAGLRRLASAHTKADLDAADALARAEKTEAEVERMRPVVEALKPDSPWPLTEVLKTLVGAAEHLLDDHDCDTHGHEHIVGAALAARSLIAALGASS